MTNECKVSRRAAIALAGRMLTSVPVVAAVTVVTPPARAVKAAKSDFFYQPKPKDGKSCASCRLFTSSAPDEGTCAIVEGDVVPNGWCMAYSPQT